jgi:ubiquinone biosynthesis monooxygenase Coq7
MTPRHTWSDILIGAFDQALKAAMVEPAPLRPSPGAGLTAPALTPAEQRRSGALLRVNHAGEVAAQALYFGQAVLARSTATREHLLAAADEERDHLAWCSERLADLQARRSMLGPAWFLGGFAAGMLAASIDDRHSLGFVAETERQVEAHLADHLERLPRADTRSRAILARMAADEVRHAAAAERAGGSELPYAARQIMSLGGGILRRIAYWL